MRRAARKSRSDPAGVAGDGRFGRYKGIGMRNFHLIAHLRRAGPRRRLWLAGIAIGLFLSTMVVGNAFVPRDKAVTRAMLGHDFLAFYTAGSFVREGRYREMYSLDA